MEGISTDNLGDICAKLDLSGLGNMSIASKRFNTVCTKLLDRRRDKNLAILEPILLNNMLMVSEPLYNYLSVAEDLPSILDERKEYARFSNSILNPNKLALGKPYISANKIIIIESAVAKALEQARNAWDDITKLVHSPATYILPIKYSSGCTEFIYYTIPVDTDVLYVDFTYQMKSYKGGFKPKTTVDDYWTHQRAQLLLMMVYVRLFDRLDKEYKQMVKERLKENKWEVSNLIEIGLISRIFRQEISLIIDST